MDGNGADGGSTALRANRRRVVVGGALTGLLAAAIALHVNPLDTRSTRTDLPPSQDALPQAVPATRHEPTASRAPAAPPVDLEAVRRRAWEKIGPRLLEAESAGRGDVDICLRDLGDFLEHRKRGVPKFSRQILSLSGKWQLVRGKLPFAAKDRHVRYLSEQFERNVFKPDELKSVLEAIVARYVKSLQSRENELLVHCRADISESDLAAVEAIPVAASNEKFSREFERLVHSVVSDVQVGLGVDVAQTVATLAAADIAVVVVRQVGTAAATQFGVDAGILGAGAGASWATFGVSLVAAIVADAILDRLIKAAGYDPAEKVTTKVHGSLERLQSLIVDGDAETREKYDALLNIAAGDPSPRLRKKAGAAIETIEKSGRLGLRRDLIRLNELRARLRAEALKRLVLQGEAL